MDLLEAKSDDIKTIKNITSEIQELTAEKVKEYYKDFDIGPGTEVCIGWSFIPLKYISEEHGSWMYNEDAILQKIEFGKFHDYELPSEQEVWMIAYGKPKAARDLIQFTVQRELESNDTKIFEVFCRPDVIDLIKEMGFKYQEDDPFGVILFEKSFN